MFGIDDAALAMLVAGGLSTAGALYTNAKNRKMQGDLNDVSVNLANTAHQREVLDLLQAGLNPILSSGGAGAAVPNLVAPSVENPMSGAANGLQGAAGYINDSYKLQNLIHYQEGRIAKYNAFVAKKDAELRDEQQITRFAQNSVDQYEALARKEAFDQMSDEEFDKYCKEVKEGVMSTAKDIANQNWRNNAGAIGGIIGALMNGTGAVLRAFK